MHELITFRENYYNEMDESDNETIISEDIYVCIIYKT